MKIDKVITPIIKDSTKYVRKNFSTNSSANIASATVVTVPAAIVLSQQGIQPAQSNRGNEVVPFEKVSRAEQKTYIEFENLINDFIDKFRIKDKENPGEWKFPSVFLQTSVDDMALELIAVIKQAENIGIDDVSLLKMYDKIKNKFVIDDEEIQKIAELKAEKAYPIQEFNLKYKQIDQKKFFLDIEKYKEIYPQKSDEKLSDYIERLYSIRKNNIEAEEKKHIENIKSKIQYDFSEDEEEKIILAPNEIEELREVLIKYNYYSGLENATENELKQYWCMLRASAMATPAPSEKIEKACIQVLPRYRSDQKLYGKDSTYDIEPLYRWHGVDMFSNVDNIAEENFKVGDIIFAKSSHSCSTDKEYCECAYCDANYNIPIKLIIHPKGQVSKARKYQNDREALYWAGTKFKVIDKRIEPFEYKYYDDASNKFYRYIIHLQEV